MGLFGDLVKASAEGMINAAQQAFDESFSTAAEIEFQFEPTEINFHTKTRNEYLNLFLHIISRILGYDNENRYLLDMNQKIKYDEDKMITAFVIQNGETIVEYGLVGMGVHLISVTGKMPVETAKHIQSEIDEIESVGYTAVHYESRESIHYHENDWLYSTTQKLVNNYLDFLEAKKIELSMLRSLTFLVRYKIKLNDNEKEEVYKILCNMDNSFAESEQLEKLDRLIDNFKGFNACTFFKTDLELDFDTKIICSLFTIVSVLMYYLIKNENVKPQQWYNFYLLKNHFNLPQTELEICYRLAEEIYKINSTLIKKLIEVDANDEAIENLLKEHTEIKKITGMGKQTELITESPKKLSNEESNTQKTVPAYREITSKTAKSNQATNTKAYNVFLQKHHKYFDPSQFSEIRKKLNMVNNDKIEKLSLITLKNPTSMFWVALILGPFGFDRFMLKQPIRGFLKLVSTVNTFGIWWFVDLFTIKKRTWKYNYNLFSDFLV